MLRLLLVLLLLSVVPVKAQVTLSGRVTDYKGKALQGVSVQISDSYDGATTDSLGIFSFITEEKGTVNVIFSAVGYGTNQSKIALNQPVIEVVVQLKELVTELKAVVISAGSFAAGDKKRGTVLSSLDVVTTASANGDIAGAVKTLPGAQQVGESEGLFVRGGTGAETRQFIDGLIVPNPFYSSVPDLAQRGRFSPFLFKGTVFSTGGYSALYGQGLSGALQLESIDLPDESSAGISASSVFLGAQYQHLSKNKQHSWGGSYGYTNLAPYFAIVKQKPDYFRIPNFHTADANFRIKTQKGILKFYTQLGTQDLGLRNPDLDSANTKLAFGLSNRNWYNNLTYRHRFNSQWKLDLGLSYNYSEDNIDQRWQDEKNNDLTANQLPYSAKTFNIQNQNHWLSYKQVLTFQWKGLSSIRVGSEHWITHETSTFNQLPAQLNNQLHAAFAEVDVFFSNKLALRSGLRGEYNTLLKKHNLAPRISLAYQAGLYGQFNAAFGRFYQNPERNYWLQSTLTQQPLDQYAASTHWIVNYQLMRNEQVLRVEAFHKKYDRLQQTLPNLNMLGHGFASGLETFWRDKKNIKNLDYWVSYSYLFTQRKHLNFPTLLEPGFGARHTANLVVKRFFSKTKTQFNANYAFATGRPYYFIKTNNDLTTTVAEQGRTIPYHNLSLSFNYLPRLGKPNNKTFIVWVLSITNVLNSRQVFNYQYSFDGSRKQAVTPPARQFFFLGCFLSFGTDRSQDAINNNL